MNRKPNREAVSRDPIVAQVRKTRDEFARKHGYDVGRIISAIQAETQAKANKKSAPRAARKSSKRNGRAA